MPNLIRKLPPIRNEDQDVERLEQRYPQGFIYRTPKGEFRFTPEGVNREDMFGTRLAVDRPPKRQFIPSVISTDRLRDRFRQNLNRLSRFERQIQPNMLGMETSTNPFAPSVIPGHPDFRNNMRGVI